jgi:hypothetical protein
MRRSAILVLTLLAAGLAAASIAHTGQAAPVARFRTPDAGAACRLEALTLVCSSLGSAGSVALSAHRARVVRRMPWWDASVPVLRVWRHDGISCRLASGAILCRAGATALRITGAGFAVVS